MASWQLIKPRRQASTRQHANMAPSPTSVVAGAEAVGYDDLRLRVKEQGQHAQVLARVDRLAKVPAAPHCTTHPSATSAAPSLPFRSASSSRRRRRRGHAWRRRRRASRSTGWVPSSQRRCRGRRRSGGRRRRSRRRRDLCLSHGLGPSFSPGPSFTLSLGLSLSLRLRLSLSLSLSLSLALTLTLTPNLTPTLTLAGER